MAKAPTFHRKYFRKAAKKIWDNIKIVKDYDSTIDWGSRDFFSCSALDAAVEEDQWILCSEYLDAYEKVSITSRRKHPKFWNEDPTEKRQIRRAENLLLVGEVLHGKKIPLIGESTYKENMDKLLEY